MDKIDKSRKGIIWALMTDKEKSMIKNAYCKGLTLVCYSGINKKYIKIDKPKWYSDISYWVKEW